MPGLYTFTAHAPGFKDPEPKKLALVSGDPVTASFLLTPGSSSGATGTLTIAPSVTDATVKVDGQVVGTGRWTGPVAAGTHYIEVSARGWKTTEVEIAVTSGATIDYPVTLTAYGDAPPEYIAPLSKPKKPPRFYLVPAVMLNTTSYRLGAPLGEPSPYGTRRDFGGGTLGVRFGYFVGNRYFAIEIDGEVGRMEKNYKINDTAVRDTETGITNWQLTPMLRFTAPRDGKVRFTAGTGVGLHGLAVEAKVAEPTRTVTKKGNGLGYSWLIDAGLQIDLGPVFLEGAIFLNVHSTQGVRDDDLDKPRLLYASPATRGGARLGIGFVFR